MHESSPTHQSSGSRFPTKLVSRKLTPSCGLLGPRAIPWHCRLETRVLICITLIAGLSLEVALLAAERIVTSNSMRRSAEDLHAAKSVFRRQMQSRADFANDQCRLIAE